jgi:hypothetical protein
MIDLKGFRANILGLSNKGSYQFQSVIDGIIDYAILNMKYALHSNETQSILKNQVIILSYLYYAK